jgi:hypothetical protein
MLRPILISPLTMDTGSLLLRFSFFRKLNSSLGHKKSPKARLNSHQLPCRHYISIGKGLASSLRTNISTPVCPPQESFVHISLPQMISCMLTRRSCLSAHVATDSLITPYASISSRINVFIIGLRKTATAFSCMLPRRSLGLPHPSLCTPPSSQTCALCWVTHKGPKKTRLSNFDLFAALCLPGGSVYCSIYHGTERPKKSDRRIVFFSPSIVPSDLFLLLSLVWS